MGAPTAGHSFPSLRARAWEHRRVVTPMRLLPLFILALGACHSAPTTTCPGPAADPAPTSEPAPEPVEAEPSPEPEPVEAEPEPPEPAIEVVAGECDLRGVPERFREEVGADQSAELVERVRAWLAGARGFGFDPRRGIAFAKSEDDQGADPPYPSWSAAQGVHACGVQGRWLVSSTRGAFATRGGEYGSGPITCQGNVCCYLATGEYDSAGGAVFTRRRDRWELRAVYQVADNGTLGEQYIADGYQTVNRHLTRLARRQCDEPRGLSSDW